MGRNIAAVDYFKGAQEVCSYLWQIGMISYGSDILTGGTPKGVSVDTLSIILYCFYPKQFECTSDSKIV